MLEKSVAKLIDRQRIWLDPIADVLGNAIVRARTSGGRQAVQVLDFLNGVWLGHPLHPAITDVPVGAWTAAFAMDAVDRIVPSDRLKRCADGAICLGITAGIGAAASGLADWQHLAGRDRRLGIMHGLLNLSALTFYTFGLVMRCSKRRSKGNTLSTLGYALASFSAYLGGELVFGSGIGVNRAAWQKPPKDYVAVLPEEELVENIPKLVHVNGTPVLLVRSHGRIHVMGETCTHLGGPLSEGRLTDDDVICPWHGSQFNLDTGCVVHGPATFPEMTYDVRIRNGQIEVKPRL